MGSSEVKAGRAYVELFLKNQIAKPLREAGKQLREFGKSTAEFGAGVAAAGTGITAPVIESLKHFSEYGSQLNILSKRTGVSATALAEFGYAAEQSGAKLDDVTGAMGAMEGFLAAIKNGSAENRLELHRVGLTYDELKDKSPEKQFEAIAAKINNIVDPAQRAAAAVKLLGGTELLPMLGEMKELRKRAQELGLAPSEAAVQAADKMDSAMTDVKKSTTAAFFNVGEALSKPITQALVSVTKIVASTGKWIHQNQDLVKTIAAVGAGIAVGGAIITGLGVAIGSTGLVMGGIATGIGMLGTVLGAILSPIGLVAVALGTGVTLWMKYTQSGQAAAAGISKMVGGMWTTVKGAMKGIFDAIAAGNLPLAGKIAMTGLRLVFLEGMSALSKAVGGSMGDMLGMVGLQIASGDLGGAWRTVVLEMESLWDGLCEGIKAGFTTAARYVTDLWQGTVKKITDMVLGNKLLSKIVLVGTGVDLQSEKGKAELNRQSEIISNQTRLGVAQGELEQSKQNGGTFTDESGTYTTEQLQKYVDDIKARLKQLDAPLDFIGDVQADARKSIDKTANSVRSRLDAIDRQAQQKSDKSSAAAKANQGGGADIANKELDHLRAQLASFQRQASEEKDKAMKDADKKNEANKDGLTNAGSNISGTFSAAALTAGGTGDPMVRRTDKLIDLSKLSIKQLTKIANRGNKNLRFS